MKLIVLMLMFAANGAKPPEVCVPTSLQAVVGVATEWNKYVAKLRTGEVDIKQWQKVESEWIKLHKSCKLY